MSEEKYSFIVKNLILKEIFNLENIVEHIPDNKINKGVVVVLWKTLESLKEELRLHS